MDRVKKLMVKDQFNLQLILKSNRSIKGTLQLCANKKDTFEQFMLLKE